MKPAKESNMDAKREDMYAGETSSMGGYVTTHGQGMDRNLPKAQCSNPFQTDGIAANLPCCVFDEAANKIIGFRR